MNVDNAPSTPSHRKLFSTEEEDIIGKFLISCWKKKLWVPHQTLYDTLKKHLDSHPRSSHTRDSKPSSVWRKKFFERNPAVEEAYDAHKILPYREFDVVSEPLLTSFLLNLSTIKQPAVVLSSTDKEAKSSSNEKISLRKSSSGNADSKHGIISTEKKKQKRQTLSPKPSLPSKGEAISSDVKSRIVHRRSKTMDSQGTVGKSVSSAESLKGSAKAAKETFRRSAGGLKLSTTLFTKPKDAARSNVKTPQQKNIAGSGSAKEKFKEYLKSSNTSDSPVVVGRRASLPSDAVSVGPIKFEVGASIEAMDCGKWYGAKIMEVNHSKKEILVHFNGWGKRFDTMFPMSSDMIRGKTVTEKKVGAMNFSIGDDVLSQWSDGTFYPGTVMSVTKSGSYVVMFYDGLKKLVRPSMLKPITEKEKEASLKAAQLAYLASLEQLQPDSSAPTVSDKATTYRRYRTSANDREKRIAARKAPDDNSPSPAATPTTRRIARKRRAGEADTSSPQGNSQTSENSSPASGGQPLPTERIRAKRARLDKITDTLLDKVTTLSSTSTVCTVSTSTSANRGLPFRPGPSEDNAQLVTSLSFDSSDESDAPLVIDEDDERKVPKVTVKKPGRKSISAQKELKTSVSKRRAASASAKVTDSSKASQEKLQRVEDAANDGEENLHKLAEAALLYTPPATSEEVKGDKTQPGAASGTERKEASEALLQLSLTRPDDVKQPEATADEEAESPPAASADAGTKVATLVIGKLDLAVTKVLKNGLSLDQAADELKVNVSHLREELLQRPGILSGCAQPQFMSEYEEDDVINWIHDITDLGWGISDAHICQRIKMFLSEHSYSVVFNNTSPINHPSTAWMSEFLDRHPEIFPGRKRPLTRFRQDREGFEDWLVRWLAMLRFYSIYPNAVYYCDEVVWDASPKLLHDVKFSHGATPLSVIAKNKISSLTCIGANGSTLPNFHVFPGCAEDTKRSPGCFRGTIALSNQGVLDSSLFLHWLKHVFTKHVPAARPVALLVDWRSDEVDYEALRFAEKNEIVLFRFLPAAAHFLQHPDQKLFGRLRLKWKKTLVSARVDKPLISTLINQFMKKYSKQNVTTEQFAAFFNEEFRQVASPSTVKMCFELTKLYTPVAQLKIKVKEVDKDKRNKRKRSKPVLYLSDEAQTASAATSGEESTKETVKDGEEVDAQLLSKEGDQSLALTEDSNRKEQEDAESSDMDASSASASSTSEEADSHALSEPATPTSSTEDHKTNNEGIIKKAKPGRPKLNKGAAPPPSAKKIHYKKGETVLAKWTDCRLYLSTVLKRIDNDRYKIRYCDGFVRVVKDDFLRPWTGTMPIQPPIKPTGAPPVKKQLDSSKKPVPTSPKLRRRSSDAKTAAAEQVAARRGSIPDDQKVRTRRSSEANSSGPQRDTRRRVPSISEVTAGERVTYKRGETVLCRWTDRRMYPATVLKQTDADHYLVKYYDERRKVVLHTWLSPWKPLTSQQATSTPSAIDAKVVQQPEIKKEREEVQSGASPRTTVNREMLVEKMGRPVVILGPDIRTTEPMGRSPSAEEKLEGEKSLLKPLFAVGDLVSWTDYRSLPATIAEILENGEYVIQYHNGILQTVKETFLKQWDPTAVPKRKRGRPRRNPFVMPQEINQQQTPTNSTRMHINQQQNQKAKGLDVKSMAPKRSVKWKASSMHKAVLAVKNGMSYSNSAREYGIPLSTLRKKISTLPFTIKPGFPSAASRQAVQSGAAASFAKSAIDNQPKGVAHGHIPKAPLHNDFAAESEINRYKCRVPGCTKVFRKDSQLQQHHRHYHLQRYKLRDQEPPAFPKRKSSRDEPPVHAKRRVSADYYADANLSPKQDALTTVEERGPRSRGGKPPIYRMKQDLHVSQVPVVGDDANEEEFQSLTSLEQPDKGLPVLEKSSPQNRKRRTRSGPVSPVAELGAKTTRSARLTEDYITSESETDAKAVEVVNEDIIHCVCGDEEEEGYMLQCESCLTWQHAQCEGIEAPVESKQTTGKEDAQKSPQGYVCTICRKPTNARKSRLYEYNNDFLTKGQLPSLTKLDNKAAVSPSEASQQHSAARERVFQEIMLTSHQLMDELVRMQETLHSIRLKTEIADPDRIHPLLHLWKNPLPDDSSSRSQLPNASAASTATDSNDAKKSDSSGASSTKETTESGSARSKESEPSGNGETTGNGSVLRTVKTVVMHMIKSVTGSPPYQVDDQLSAAASGGDSDKNDEKMEVDDAAVSASRNMKFVANRNDREPLVCASFVNSKQPIVETTLDDSEMNSSPSGSARSKEENSEERGKESANDIWKPIEIKRTLEKSSTDALNRRRSTRTDDGQDEVLMRCRGNLLSHVHHLEETLSQRLTKLEEYVSAIESAYERHRRASPTSSSDSSSSYDRRLGELQSDIGAMHGDLDAVYDLLSTNV